MKQEHEEGPKQLLIIGAGGLGNEYAWVAGEMNEVALRNGSVNAIWNVLGFTDDDAKKKGSVLGGHVVVGTVNEAFARFGDKDVGFAVAIGDNKTRERIASEAESLGWTPETLVHPSAIVAGGAELGIGSYLGPGTVICPGTKLGKHVIVNTHVSIGHDSTLEDFVQVCPGARVSGGCRVGKRGFLGSNAVLMPKASVGEDAVVGASSLVLRKVLSGTTVLGCPAVSFGKTR